MRRGIALLALGLLVAGCRQDMHDQPRYKPFAKSDFFGDERSARPFVEGTVARGQLREDEHLYTGRVNGELAASFPVEITAELLARGRERFDIFCSPCHDRLGRGNGMVVQRGFRQPTSFHDERLRAALPGHFFDVMTNGFGAMPSYASQVPVRDRWAIAAYIRALQLSQRAAVGDVPESERASLSAPSASEPRAVTGEGH
jgi:mono/diheme cytochrome c family protein